MVRIPWSPSGLDFERVLAVALVGLVLAGLPIASAPAVASITPGTTTFFVEQTDSEVSNLDNVVLEGQERGYDGGIASVTLYLNNTGSDLSADVRVGLKDADGSVLAQQVKEGHLLSPGVNEITFTFSRSYDPGNVALVQITAASSL